MKKLMLTLLVLLMIPGVFGLISGNFTQIEEPNVVDYMFAFENSLPNISVWFYVAVALGIVAGAAVFTWSNDWVNSALFGSFLATFIGFILVLIEKNGQRLITWDDFSLIVTVLTLLAIYKKVSDK